MRRHLEQKNAGATDAEGPQNAPIGIADTQLSEAEIGAAMEVLRSGMLRQGKVCVAFEAAFASFTGAEHAVICANGTAALHLAYLASVKPGDEVLVPSFTFFATASMVTAAGAKPIFCDVEPDSGLIDLLDAARRVTPRTRAIAAVHLFGNPCDLTAVQNFAEEHGLAVIWDAAQAHGARFKGRDVGSAPGIVTYSFYPTKNMFVGEGGMITVDDTETADSIRLLRSHGDAGRYEHVQLGFNYRGTDISAAIGLSQLERLPEMLARRRANASALLEGLSGIAGLELPVTTPGGEHAWHQFVIQIDPAVFGIDRDALGLRLKSSGIQSAVHYPRGLHQQPVFEGLYGASNLPVTERLARQVLALPVHHGLSADEIDRIVTAVRGAAVPTR